MPRWKKTRLKIKKCNSIIELIALTPNKHLYLFLFFLCVHIYNKVANAMLMSPNFAKVVVTHPCQRYAPFQQFWMKIDVTFLQCHHVFFITFQCRQVHFYIIRKTSFFKLKFEEFLVDIVGFFVVWVLYQESMHIVWKLCLLATFVNFYQD
jgi:hypothetical protein